jgi:hypothetical protein
MEFGGRWHGEPGSRELRGVIGRDTLTERWWARLPTFELLVAGYATPDEAVASILEAQALLTGRPLGADVDVDVNGLGRVVYRRRRVRA